ncbi:MAG TPA: hypothetical protein VGH28_14010 [Polyangiaceae bacterium]|jgi:hypothetical protein
MKRKSSPLHRTDRVPVPPELRLELARLDVALGRKRTAALAKCSVDLVAELTTPYALVLPTTIERARAALAESASEVA